MRRRMLVVMGILGIAALLAFPLRDAVYEAVIIPIAYVLWVLGLIYHSVHQSVWWFIILFVVLIILSRSLLPKRRFRKKAPVRSKPLKGQVESLAIWMKKAEQGTYFKWLLANRLGKIAHQILSQRATGKPRSYFDPLTGPDWEPERGLQSYLESGLYGSFADFPQKRRYFSKPERTPLDHDVREVIGFLEMQAKD